jgi:cysteine-rich repeat protein
VRLVLALLLLGSSSATAQVVFQEDFEGSVAEIQAHFGDGSTGPEVALSSDRPSASPGRQSLVLRGSQPTTPSLYHRLPQNESQLYVRYFVKYQGNADFGHSGLYLGGYLPPTDWPQGDAGLKGVRPNGDKLVSIGFESIGWSAPDRLDFYLNWIDMKGGTYQGQYYGRSMLVTESPTNVAGAWRCVEVMAKLNSTGAIRDGELALWLDGALVRHFRPGAPTGSWDAAGNWVTSPSGQPFEGFLWRDTTSLGLNWVRVLNYASPHDVLVDDLVASRTRVGCGAAAFCGNRAVEPGEACDDGNRTAGDGCSDSCEVEECANGIDDDGDGRVDAGSDPGCAAAWDLSERDPTTACDDGADNDGDGRADFRAAGGGDLGCADPTSPTEAPACQDGADNDGQPGRDFDGGASVNGGVAVDARDPQCLHPWQRRESAGCGLGFELALLAPLAARRRRARRRPPYSTPA